MLTLEPLEPRDIPATLDISGGALAFANDPGETTSLTVAVSGGVYSFNDKTALIALTAGAVAAGWRGTGTHTVSGPESSVDRIAIGVDAGAVNLRSAHDPVEVEAGTGAVTVTLNSVAPTYIGNLSTITAPVTVDAGLDTTLNVSDYTGVRHDGVPVTVTATSIDDLAADPITLSGTFATIHVWGPHGTPPSGYDVIAPPTSDFRLN